MNPSGNKTRPETLDRSDERLAKVPNDLIKNAMPVGTFAGPQDFVLRFHDGKLVATNSGEQGGGQN
jgi:hypothetical protein